MIKNIIFDFGNVLIKTDYEEIIKHFTKNQEEKEFIINEVVGSPEMSKYGLINTGFLTIEEVIQLINDRTNNIHKELVENFLLNYIKYKKWNDNILEIVQNLKNNGYKLYVLSNISEYVFKNFRSTLEPLFDGLVLSYEIHKIKPYNAIYKYIIDKYNLNPDETLFIDDTKVNMESANKLGIKGRKVEASNIEDIKLILKEYGVDY